MSAFSCLPPTQNNAIGWFRSLRSLRAPRRLSVTARAVVPGVGIELEGMQAPCRGRARQPRIRLAPARVNCTEVMGRWHTCFSPPASCSVPPSQ
jgi:hypothetical protein